MKDTEYIKLSQNTMASQSRDQRNISIYDIQDALEIVYTGNLCDKLKRKIYYQDKNTEDRFFKNNEEIGKILQNTVALATAIDSQDKIISLTQDKMDLLHSCLGLSSEVGEVTEAIFKFINNNEVDHINIKEEVGDILWYLAILCRYYNFTFEDAMISNYNKLSSRFPEKFTSKKAINRNLQKEREILEQ